MNKGFLTNYSETTFLNKIKDSLRRCKSFYFSVSFIKKAGLMLIIKDLTFALERGAKGKVITSTYQNFTDIETLKIFLNLQNEHEDFQCTVDFNSFRNENNYSQNGFHTKGYLFEYESSKEVVIGSSNITSYALLRNIEWNVSLEGQNQDKIFNDTFEEFDYLWSKTQPLTEDLILKYTKQLGFAIERWDMDYDFVVLNKKPNYMQRKALKELNRYRAIGLKRALVISAAGSGKTFLAAFDALNFNPVKLLYIVHEGTILRKSMETFGEVFVSNKSLGILDSTNKDLNTDFLFSTNISISKNLELFNPTEFDYIIIDEAHHAASSTYLKIINYFKPEFLLGLTATPERMDNQDIFELFDQNVPFELRLRDAILNDLIVPFKYYGIRDQLVEYGLNKDEERKMISQMADTDHVDFIYSEIEKYKIPGEKIKAIAFCKNITHARMMSESMNQYYHTAYLTGSNNVGERIRAYNDLQDENAPLEILFTVDILNEGVDIPGVNMVIFLRPTESSTVFIQQLGRGLRKFEGKEYVTVLDFIGNNYKRSFQLIMALSSLSENFVLEKRLMLSLIEDDFKQLGLLEKGVEINFDSLSKEEIKFHVDSENFNKIRYIKKEYEDFKNYVNAETFPSHLDYFENKDVSPDLIRFMNIPIGGKKNKSYYNFLKGVGEENLPHLNEKEVEFIDYLSQMLPLVRTYEFEIINCILKGYKNLDDIKRILAQGNNYNQLDFNHAASLIAKTEFVSFPKCELTFDISSNYFYEYLDDLISYGIQRYELENKGQHDFKLWSNYRRDLVLLKLRQNPLNNFYGTYTFDKNVYIFADLKKDEKISEHLKYKDKFLEKNLFQWETTTGVYIYNKEGEKLINSEQAFVFVRKVKSENGITMPHTYVGTGKLTNPRKSQNEKGTILFDIKMDDDLPAYLQYDFDLEK